MNRLVPIPCIHALVAVFLGGSAALLEAQDFTLRHAIGRDGKESSFTFEFVSPAFTDAKVLDRIIVAMPGGKRQTLRANFNDGEFSAGRMQGKVRFSDLNGDGHEDLLVPLYSSPMDNSADFVWIYAPGDAEFVYCPELTGQNNLKADGKGGAETYTRNGGADRTTHHYLWTGKRFELVRTYQMRIREGKLIETQRSRKDGKWTEDFSRPVEAQ